MISLFHLNGEMALSDTKEVPCDVVKNAGAVINEMTNPGCPCEQDSAVQGGPALCCVSEKGKCWHLSPSCSSQLMGLDDQNHS